MRSLLDPIERLYIWFSEPIGTGSACTVFFADNTVEIKNMLSGEVWFCSGQSNMDSAMSQLARSFPKRTEKI